MTERKRQVTGEAQGTFLASLLNQEIGKRDWRARSLQQEVHTMLVQITVLEGQLAGTPARPAGRSTAHITRLIDRLNRVLESYGEHPQLFIPLSSQLQPRLHVDFVPFEGGAMRRSAIGAVCSLIRYGLLDRVRRCQRTADQQGGVCGRWFFAKKSDSIYCSRDCQIKPTEERTLHKREYARRRYREEQQRQQLAKKTIMAGGRK